MIWFKRTGLFFIPTATAGWLILGAAAGFAIKRFLDIDSKSHSVSDTLINWVFSLLIIGVVYTLLAFFTSDKE